MITHRPVLLAMQVACAVNLYVRLAAAAAPVGWRPRVLGLVLLLGGPLASSCLAPALSRTASLCPPSNAAEVASNPTLGKRTGPAQSPLRPHLFICLQHPRLNS